MGLPSIIPREPPERAPKVMAITARSGLCVVVLATGPCAHPVLRFRTPGGRHVCAAPPALSRLPSRLLGAPVCLQRVRHRSGGGRSEPPRAARAAGAAPAARRGRSHGGGGP